MKKLITLALAALVLSPLINASDKEREINEKPVKPAVIQPVIDNQQLFLDNLHKCGLIKRMVKEDLEQLINDEVTGDTFAQERRSLVQKAIVATWKLYIKSADGQRISPKKREDMFNTFKMLVIEPLENVTQKLENVDGEILTNLLPFCRYMLIKKPLLKKIEFAFAQKTGELIAKNNSYFETKAGKRLLKVLKWHGFEEKKRMLPEPIAKIFTHEAHVNGVAFSPDGTKITTALDNNTTQLWDVATGQLLQTFTHNGDVTNVTNVTFSPNGETIATTSDKTAQVWTVNPTLSLANVVIIQALHECKKTETFVDVATNKKLGTLINKLPTTIKKYYIESGVVKNLVPRNRKFFDNRIQHLRKRKSRYAYSYLTSR